MSYIITLLAACLVLGSACAEGSRQQAANLADGLGEAAVRLSNGLKMPVVGLGTWLVTEEGQAYASVTEALTTGYRHIDTAWIYMNQQEVGRAVKDFVAKSNGKVRREDIFITSKVFPPHFGSGLVAESVRETLEQLQVTYVDQMLLHWPVTLVGERDPQSGSINPYPKNADGSFKVDADRKLRDVWLELESIYKAGLAKSIGVSNFEPYHIKQVVNPSVGGECAECSVVPHVNQVELHPAWPQRNLRRFCDQLDIQIVAYAPLANPSVKGREGEVHPNPLGHPVIAEIAEHHGRTPAQVLLRWSLQLGNVVIPKSVNPKRIKENSDIFEFELGDDEMKAVEYLGMDKTSRLRLFNPPFTPHGGQIFPEDTEEDVPDPFEAMAAAASGGEGEQEL